ncbi:hypothetical protein [Paraburkholderia sp. D1E]|uniref:hypothetical protein n=1 Tax=Paraburkholderia sp. D1E TaxID=3461398 RepID=UPI0040460903
MKPGKLIIVEVPFSTDLEVSNPERLAMKFEGSESLGHIWTFAYLRREKRIGKPADWPIDEASFFPPRVAVIANLAKVLSQIMRGKGCSAISLFHQYRTLVSFMDWLDERNRGALVWIERDVSEAAVLDFCRELTVDVANEKISSKTASLNQANLLEIAREYYDDRICRTFRPIRQQRGTPTRAPDEGALKSFRACMSEVFDIASKTVVYFEPFPVRFAIFDGEESRQIWHFPNGKSASTLSGVRGGAAWNANTGSLRTVEEIKSIYAPSSKNPSSAAHKALRDAERILNESNTKKHHAERLSLASFGCLAFAALFALETGLNQSVLQGLDFSETLREDLKNGAVTRKSFRAMKFRAGGKEITASISLRFLPYLQRYFDLRDYVMQEKGCASLFVFVDSNGEGAPLPNGWFKTFLKRRVKRLGIVLPKMGLRKIRAAKQDYLIRHATPEVAAAIMGHSLQTALSSYSNGSEANHALEMGQYLVSLEETIVRASQGLGDALESGVGKCTDYLNPVPIATDTPIVPKCDSSEGCLFCGKYRIHADEIDVRKIVSCRYSLNVTFGTNGGEDVIIRTLQRIETLLGELREINAELVERVTREVDEDEALDPFWAAKLEQLAVLGLL